MSVIHVNDLLKDLSASDGWAGRRDLVVKILVKSGGRVIWPDGFPRVEICRGAIPKQVVNTGVRID